MRLNLLRCLPGMDQRSLYLSAMRIYTNTNTLEITKKEVVADSGDLAYDAVLVAIGRKPNTDLGLKQAGIKTGERGKILVDELCAVGGVKSACSFPTFCEMIFVSLKIPFRLRERNDKKTASSLRRFFCSMQILFH